MRDKVPFFVVLVGDFYRIKQENSKMEKYELVKDLGSGNFGVARLMRNKETKELVAMKYIERGHKVCFIRVVRQIINISVDCHCIRFFYLLGGLIFWCFEIFRCWYVIGLSELMMVECTILP